MPPLLTKPLVATDGLSYNKANNTFLNSARKNDVEAGYVEFSLKVMERAEVTCYWCKAAVKKDSLLVYLLKFFGILAGRRGV